MLRPGLVLGIYARELASEGFENGLERQQANATSVAIS